MFKNDHVDPAVFDQITNLDDAEKQLKIMMGSDWGNEKMDETHGTQVECTPTAAQANMYLTGSEIGNIINIQTTPTPK